ncbi:hypothetical protein PF003_g18720 [Phytophthora fragariae]|nr:hypothetical protein PF003_g18720 [Phytophthora fragariae]
MSRSQDPSIWEPRANGRSGSLILTLQYCKRDDQRAERDDLRVQFAAAQGALPPAQARLDAVVAVRDLAQQAVGLTERQRDDAFAERDRHRRTLVIVEQERDDAVDMRDQARRASVTLIRQRDAAVAEKGSGSSSVGHSRAAACRYGRGAPRRA